MLETNFREFPTQSLLEQYARTSDESVSNELIERYQGLINNTASRIYNKIPFGINIADLMTPGLFTLMNSIDDYKADRDGEFERYVTKRVRKAMIREIRSMKCLPKKGSRGDPAVIAGKLNQENPLIDNQSVILKYFMKRDLDKRERLMLILRYYEGMNMRDIGKTLDITTKEAKTIHSQVMEKMRRKISSVN